MKVLIAGETDAFIKAFIKKYKTKFELCVAERETDFSRFEQADKTFRNKKYDAVIYYTPFSAESGATADIGEIVKFKNVQYAAILNGVKKMLVLTDSLHLARELKEADEKAVENAVPSEGGALTDYMISLLADKDKISTVLRAFGLFGYGVKPQKSHAMKIVSAALSKKSIAIDGDGIVNALYMEDYHKIIAAFLENNFPKGIYNVAPDEKTSLMDIAKKSRATAKKFEKEFTAEFASKEITFEHTASNKKLRGVLPEFKFTQLTNAITKTFGEKIK